MLCYHCLFAVLVGWWRQYYTSKLTRGPCIWGDGEGDREGGVAPVYPGDCEGVLFTYEFVGVLLALASKAAIGEIVAVEVLVITVVS